MKIMALCLALLLMLTSCGLPQSKGEDTDSITSEIGTQVKGYTAESVAGDTETEESSSEELTTEAPTAETPTTEAITTEAPATEAPTTEAITTEAPATEAPTTEAATTAPVTPGGTGGSVSVHTHTPITLEAVAPTCTESGLSEGKKCSSCGAVTVPQTTINPTGHKKVTGEDGGVYCSVCTTVLVKMYNATFEIGTLVGATGEEGSNNKRFRTKEYIPIEDFDALTFEKGYSLTWLAYGADKKYMGNGSNAYPKLPTAGVWLADGKGITADEILAWNADVKYVRFVIKKIGNTEISLESDVEASKIKIYSSGYEPPAPPVYTYEYSGESLGTTNTVSITGVADITGLQDGAAYAGYFFALEGNGKCKVYSVEGYKLVTEFTLDKVNVFKPHSNAVCFGSTRYDENDEFPLLYSNIYNNYGKDNADMIGACGVYRIMREGSSFKSTLVQVIKVGFTDDVELWASEEGDTRPYGNFVVDTDRNKLIAFTMRDGDSSTRFFEFDIPALDAGVPDETLGVKRVVLNKSDITEKFSVPYFRYIQGCTYYNGRVYSLEGFTNDTKNPASMKIVDLSEKALATEIKLYEMGLKIEPEAVYVIDGVLYYAEVTGNIYKVIFN